MWVRAVLSEMNSVLEMYTDPYPRLRYCSISRSRFVRAVSYTHLDVYKRQLEDWYDSNAAQGQFEGKSKEEIQAALNEEVAKGMMNISIAASITFADGSSEGEARIENIAANPMDQKVVITLKDSGETVYESAAIAPDQHIQTIKLTKDLDPGQYAAVATFTGYDRETHKQTGQAAAEIVLNVEG